MRNIWPINLTTDKINRYLKEYKPLELTQEKIDSIISPVTCKRSIHVITKVKRRSSKNLRLVIFYLCNTNREESLSFQFNRDVQTF